MDCQFQLYSKSLLKQVSTSSVTYIQSITLGTRHIPETIINQLVRGDKSIKSILLLYFEKTRIHKQ